MSSPESFKTPGGSVCPSTAYWYEDKFQAKFDIQRFSRDEISVKVFPNGFKVTGKHVDTSTSTNYGGFMKKLFTKEYNVSDDYDTSKYHVEWHPGDIMIVTVPRSRPSRPSRLARRHTI